MYDSNESSSKCVLQTTELFSSLRYAIQQMITCDLTSSACACNAHFMHRLSVNSNYLLYCVTNIYAFCSLSFRITIVCVPFAWMLLLIICLSFYNIYSIWRWSKLYHGKLSEHLLCTCAHWSDLISFSQLQTSFFGMNFMWSMCECV